MSRTTRIVPILVAAALVLTGVIYAAVRSGATVDRNDVLGSMQPVSTTTPRSPEVVSAEGCGVCMTEEDNGSRVSVIELSSVVLELPAAVYKKAVTIEPEGVLGEPSPMDASTRGMWAQSFEALRPGTATITVDSTRTNVREFTLHVIVSPQATTSTIPSSGFRNTLLSWF